MKLAIPLRSRVRIFAAVMLTALITCLINFIMRVLGSVAAISYGIYEDLIVVPTMVFNMVDDARGGLSVLDAAKKLEQMRSEQAQASKNKPTP